MDYDDVLFNVLTQTNPHDLKRLCQTNQQINRLCHHSHFLKQQFDKLPLVLPIDKTLNNLFHVYDVMTVARKLIRFMKQGRISFYLPFTNIHDMDTISPTILDKLLQQAKTMHVNIDPTDRLYGRIEGKMYLSYQEYMDPILDDYIKTKDKQFYLNYWFYAPDDVMGYLPLSNHTMEQFLIHLFLSTMKPYGLALFQDNGFHKKFHDVKQLEKFLDTIFIPVSFKK